MKELSALTIILEEALTSFFFIKMNAPTARPEKQYFQLPI